MDIAIDSKWIYYPKEAKLIENGRIIIEGKEIVYSGPRNDSDAALAGHEVFSFENGIVIPGLINGHTHLPETLLRGICDDATLDVWLYDYIWKVEPEMTPKDAYWGALLGIAELLASGTVGFNDQYFYASQIAKAVEETGIKASLAPSIFFEGNPQSDSMEKAFNHAKKTHDQWNGKDQRIWVDFGPHAPYTVDKDWFTTIAEEARKRAIQVHTHLNETYEFEVKKAMENWGMRPIEYLDSLGLFDVTKKAAHCIWISENEINLLKEHNVSVLHCPKSNAKVGAGIADVPKLLKNDINVCIGTDGSASNNKLDMIEEMAFTALIHKAAKGNPTVVPSSAVLKMATVNGSQLFPDGIYAGTLEAGTPADIAVIDLGSIATTPIINPDSHLTYSISRSNVVMTVVDGEILYLNGELLSMDIEKIKDKAQQAINRMRQAAAAKNED